jgi:predicted SnoaL-like aldol condensation-catalyzing enzyme
MVTVGTRREEDTMQHDDFIRRYLVEVYSNRRLDMVGEFIGEPQIRHDAGVTHTLSLAASTERVAGFFETYTTLDFWPVILIAQDDMVSCAWNANLTPRAGATVEFSAIELFRIADAKIVEVWNTAATRGHWLP